MDIDEAIFGRSSVRVFDSREISDEVLKKIIKAGVYAPSACNFQEWKFIVVRKKDRSMFYSEVIASAPVVVFVSYRCDVTNVSGYKHGDYIQSAAAAIQNMLLMAYSIGIGGCWVCDLPDKETLSRCFNIPSNYEVIAAVALGYPRNSESNKLSTKVFHNEDEASFDRRQRRYPLEQIVFSERYGVPMWKDTDQASNNGNLIINKSSECVRDYWIKCMLKIAHPVLSACSNNKLYKLMPKESKSTERANKYGCLEALGRTILGIAPWLELDEADEQLMVVKEKYREMTRKCIENAVNPCAPDYMNWSDGDQPLVDAAFLVYGILQAKTQLWDSLSNETQRRFLQEIKKTRSIRPWRSNWILFSAMIEVFILTVEGESECIKSVIDYGVSQHDLWYVGDGLYKDGDVFHYDFYNSIVIHPFLLEITKRVPWLDYDKYLLRSRRYSKILLSMINIDGSYPLIGRSVTYRGGVFHLLAKMASEELYNEKEGNNICVSPGEVRTALMSVLNKYMSGDIFDENGWLRIGIVDSQKEMSEEYVNTGSLYFFMAMFMATGCSSESRFWKDEKELHFSEKIWNGEQCQADYSLEGWV